ncbi:hypothetical protein HPB50_008683 [Hyalomma asiaticum]|uniref:Uncharacterized protein n=1 Tax=Hyalomma asiaticum TaxID=266040 RepID=A0ACB7RIY6_HYAAI|nr:hypothetical protein HPB50_008683 [Hyalomma asiaticum]
MQEAYPPPGGGVYSPGGTYAPPPAAVPYMGPAYVASQTQLSPPAVYGPQPYAAVPYGPPAMSPMDPYGAGYANYAYGLPPPQSPRQFIVQSPEPRKGMLTTDNILTVLMVGGTLFLVVFAMLLIVTVVVPRLTRKHHSGHRRRHEFPAEHDYLADAESPVEGPQMSMQVKDEQTESKLHAAGADHAPKHGHKGPETAKHLKRRARA